MSSDANDKPRTLRMEHKAGKTTHFSHPLTSIGDRNGTVSLGIGASTSVLGLKSEKSFVLCLEARNAGIWLYWSLGSFLSYINVLTVDIFNITEINSLEGY